MAKKLTRIERDIRDNPDKYDFQDVPPARVKIPEQEAAYDALEPEWSKKLSGKRERI